MHLCPRCHQVCDCDAVEDVERPARSDRARGQMVDVIPDDCLHECADFYPWDVDTGADDEASA